MTDTPRSPTRTPRFGARALARVLAMFGLAGSLPAPPPPPTIRVPRDDAWGRHAHPARRWHAGKYRATKHRRGTRQERKRRRLAVKAARRANRGAPRR